MRRQSLDAIDIDDGQPQVPTDVDLFQSGATCSTNSPIHQWNSLSNDSLWKRGSDNDDDVPGTFSSRCWMPSEQATAAVSVRMSLLNELSTHSNETEELPVTRAWRHTETALEGESHWGASWSSSASDPGWTLDEHDREHEERRVLERFASFPSGRPVTPKTRRYSKRKGADSPRYSASPVPPSEAASQQEEQQMMDLTRSEDAEIAEPVVSQNLRGTGIWPIEQNSDEMLDIEMETRVSPQLDEPMEFFSAQRFRGGHDVQERRTTFLALGSLRHSSPEASSDESPAAQRARQLVRLIHSLKEKVKVYEDAFEKRYGYRPSYHQKMNDRTTKRLLTDLARARKELKQLREKFHLMETEVTECLAGLNPAEKAEILSSGSSSVEQTVADIHEQLAKNRDLAGRPEDVDQLNTQQILDEKLAVQRALLYMESVHGRPSSPHQKEVLRPLYDRYRVLKRMVVRAGLSRSKEEIAELAPILEHETLELNHHDCWKRHSAPATPSLDAISELPRPVGRRYTAPLDDSQLCLESESNLGSFRKDSPQGKRQKITINIEENLHSLPLHKLVEQLRQVREEKRRLRKMIRDKETGILRSDARPSSDPETDDELWTQHPMEPIYAQYRHARAKLRLLEALVSKQDGSATL